MIRKLLIFSRLSRRDQFTAVEAVGALCAARLAIAVLPRGWLTDRCGVLGGESPERLPAAIEQQIAALSHVLAGVKRVLPWHTTCLAEALAARWLLARRGIPTTLYIGVRPAASIHPAGLDAHAWLRAGRCYVTGEPRHAEYQVLAHYAHCPARSIT